mmetsp:Transcript_54118/g.167790  ORF Transcript_54118/g.167790 Transcript_54118/m.167790 type:complete len:233 (-) Transcript_54118:25-723(-)
MRLGQPAAETAVLDGDEGHEVVANCTWTLRERGAVVADPLQVPDDVDQGLEHLGALPGADPRRLEESVRNARPLAAPGPRGAAAGEAPLLRDDPLLPAEAKLHAVPAGALRAKRLRHGMDLQRLGPEGYRLGQDVALYVRPQLRIDVLRVYHLVADSHGLHRLRVDLLARLERLPLTAEPAAAEVALPRSLQWGPRLHLIVVRAGQGTVLQKRQASYRQATTSSTSPAVCRR